MANIKSAKKRIRTINKKTSRNVRIKNHVKEAEKNFFNAIEKKDFDEAGKAFKLAEKKLMQAASKGVMHKKTASRTVSRLSKRLKNIERTI